jgi:tetratricopeptide (TPR) repeat protein
MPTDNPGATRDLQTALRSATQLLRRDPEAAAEQAREILRVFPEEQYTTVLLATAERRSGNFESAIEVVSGLLEQHSDSALALEELGLSLLATRRWVEAEDALTKSVSIDDELAAAWKALGDIRSERGDASGSRDAYRRHIQLSAGDPELVKAADALFAGKLGVAETLCREFLKRQPTNVSAIRMLAEVGIKIGRLDDAEKLLTRCLELAPDFHLARHNFANLLFKKLRYHEALAEVDKVIDAEPNRPSHLLLKAAILGRIGRTDEAIEIYDVVLRQ